jgi:DNA-binding NarL/FixJ family response regulator
LNITIVIFDEQPLSRFAIRSILDSVPEFCVAGEADTSEDAAALISQCQPRVVLISTYGDEDAVGTIRRTLNDAPNVGIILLRPFYDARTVQEFITAGAAGCLLTKVTYGELVGAVHEIAMGQDRVVLAVPRVSVTDMARQVSDPISPREREILRLAATSFTNAQIGVRLNIKETTVKRHLHNIYGKLGAVSRIDAVTRAVRSGIIDISLGPRADSELLPKL